MRHPGRTRSVGLILLAATLAAGCQSRTPREPEVGEPLRAGHLISFTPISTVSSIHFAEGRYPALFSPTSSAIWLTGHSPEPLRLPPDPATAPPQPPAAPPGAPAATPVPAPPATVAPAAPEDRFAVFECRMSSGFSDMSISYDAVGFNGVNVYLETPGGQQVPPGEVRMGKDLLETQHGALKEFGRVNQVVFPREALRLVVPEGGGSPPLRLVLEGYGCKFYFEWNADLPTVIGPPPFGQSESAQRTREGLKKTREKVKGWSHTMD